jgi:hypothetical protein
VGYADGEVVESASPSEGELAEFVDGIYSYSVVRIVSSVADPCCFDRCEVGPFGCFPVQ